MAVTGVIAGGTAVGGRLRKQGEADAVQVEMYGVSQLVRRCLEEKFPSEPRVGKAEVEKDHGAKALVCDSGVPGWRTRANVCEEVVVFASSGSEAVALTERPIVDPLVSYLDQDMPEPTGTVGLHGPNLRQDSVNGLGRVEPRRSKIEGQGFLAGIGENR